ncbi:MAG: DUF5658 family protein [Armatimonadota bacterium]
MTLEQETVQARYFWSGWFTGQSFALLAVLYLILSFADLYATIRLIPFGIKEGNPLADWALQNYGNIGFAVYKLVIVLFLLGIVRVIERRKVHTAHLLLWTANIVMAFVAIRHIAILATYL